MKRISTIILLVMGTIAAQAQPVNPRDTSAEQQYRASSTKINDVVHTRLEVQFDFDKSYMYGKEWITLKPHFYATDTVTLDAKGMDIKELDIVHGNILTKLNYSYDSLQLRIELGQTFKANQTYTLYISYTSKPNEVTEHGSAAITDAKGLYFINPKGEEKNKPTEIWTQGETEANSVWMPTIDKPDQKSTEEIAMTVPDKYVTLSNGLMVKQQKNANGTRTDYWKMDLPHAPYLFFMGVGNYAIIKDSYKGKEVNYYVEKPWAPYAKGIFGHTPEMIAFYEKILGVPFPWPKYDQMVGADYVSGAMENTTATLHQESAYQNNRQLIDGNKWEVDICHELFHQWFGDLVTCESWSNITVNESFANYSETLWTTYKYGKDAGDDENQKSLIRYLKSPVAATKDLVRFHYAGEEDPFDVVSYNKGGRILHMLRNYVGDSAFFKSLHLYLETNKFKTGEAQQLRLAFEEITGQDLNWFWNQWYYGSGHPKLDIRYSYDDKAGKASVIVNQTQETGKVFILPIAIDVYTGDAKTRTKVWILDKTDTFTFNYTKRPDLINVDADKILLCEKTDNKTADNFIFQMKHAPNYMDRREAIEYFAANDRKELSLGLNDKYPGLRMYTIDMLEESKTIKDSSTIKRIEAIATTDKDKRTQAKAIEFLAQLNDPQYLPLFNQFVTDSSYSVSAAALDGLSTLDYIKAYTLAKQFSSDARGPLGEMIVNILVVKGSQDDYDYITNYYATLTSSQDKYLLSYEYCLYLSKIQDVTKIKNGIDEVTNFGKSIPDVYRSFTDITIKRGLDKIAAAQGAEISNYINAHWPK